VVNKAAQLALKFFVVISFVAISSGSEARLERRLQKIFRAPLIVGASVSAGHGTASPGDVASLRFVGRAQITNIARDGAYGKEFANVAVSDLSRYSVIIGVDFLFWDSTLSDLSESQYVLHQFIRSARRAGVPLVLGDIPKLLPFIQDVGRDRLNEQIHAECLPKYHCRILKLDQLHQIAETGGLLIEGRLYHYGDLTADGLHLKPIASRHLARKIIELLED